jgi:hypothetical protein
VVAALQNHYTWSLRYHFVTAIKKNKLALWQLVPETMGISYKWHATDVWCYHRITKQASVCPKPLLHLKISYNTQFSPIVTNPIDTNKHHDASHVISYLFTCWQSLTADMVHLLIQSVNPPAHLVPKHTHNMEINSRNFLLKIIPVKCHFLVT